jgi:transposase InsO family protein
VKRVSTLIDSRRAPGQEERRRAERTVRRRAVAFARAARDLSTDEAAERLRIPGRTLRDWTEQWRVDRLPARRRGATPDLATDEEKRLLLGLVALLGHRIGYGRVRFFVPTLSRRVARRWLGRYRRSWGWAQTVGLLVLSWTRPGSVWAADFSEAPTPIEGRYRYLLSVRDLASGEQLLSLPCRDVTEATALATLEALFKEHGAPLVLKIDNGSAFVAEGFRGLLEDFGVAALYSPPRTPKYNGACEAGIGGLKTRAHHLASFAGRPGEWTIEDVERARCLGNEHGRPFGRSQPTPSERWAARAPITPEEDDAFREAVQRARDEQRAARVGEPGRSRLALEERSAIARALTELGYLEFKTRRVSQPLSSRFSANIP